MLPVVPLELLSPLRIILLALVRCVSIFSLFTQVMTFAYFQRVLPHVVLAQVPPIFASPVLMVNLLLLASASQPAHLIHSPPLVPA